MAEKVFSVESAEDSSGFLLWQVTTLWQRGIKKALDKHNLTHTQYVLLASLMWLSRQNKHVTQIDLSSHSQIDPMTTSSVLKLLLTKGFIQREEHSADTRAKVVALTTTGSTIVKQAIKTVEKFDKDFFEVLGNKVPDFNKHMLKIISNKDQTDS